MVGRKLPNPTQPRLRLNRRALCNRGFCPSEEQPTRVRGVLHTRACIQTLCIQALHQSSRDPAEAKTTAITAEPRAQMEPQWQAEACSHQNQNARQSHNPAGLQSRQSRNGRQSHNPARAKMPVGGATPPKPQYPEEPRCPAQLQCPTEARFRQSQNARRRCNPRRSQNNHHRC